MSGRIWEFCSCEFDERRRELRCRGVAVDIEAKPLAVLRELLEHPGEVLTKDELFEAAWPGVAVTDSSLATAISKLRKAVGDDGMIATVSGVGYRLTVPARIRLAEAPKDWERLTLASGDAVPGREQWRLGHRLDLSPSSEVWLAEHVKTGEQRVFKFATDAERLRSLKREITVARLLRASLGSQAAFADILEWQFDRVPFFLESEFVGPNLAQWAAMRGGLAAVPMEHRLAMAIEMCDAVAAAHGVGVLHKDLKPTNILIRSDADVPTVAIADFGAATLLTPSRLAVLNITNLGFTQAAAHGQAAVSGTAMYLAPEVVAGQSPSVQSDVYALGVLLYQLVIGDLRQPLAPGWEAKIADPELRDDIAGAADVDLARRFPGANVLGERLRALASRRREREQRERVHAAGASSGRAGVRARGARLWLALGAATAAVAAALTLWMLTDPERASAGGERQVSTIAVAPLENTQQEAPLEYLKLALADEVVDVLRRGPWSVRPLSIGGSPQEADLIVSGYFAHVGDELRITLQATDRLQNRLVWHDQMVSPFDSLIATRMQLALRVREGLAASLGSAITAMTPVPTHEDAYALYLRSVAVPFDPEPNPDGIALLEQALALDDSYAPAWLALGRRYYVAGRYATNDGSLFAKGLEANRRAASLDADYASAAVVAYGPQIEGGDLLGAYGRLQEALRRWPQSADVHFQVSYLFRYAGRLDQAAAECETALRLDASTQDSGLRSCAVVFMLQSDYPRARNYLALDQGTEFSRAMNIHMLMRQGRAADAVALDVPRIPEWTSYPLLLACASGRPQAEIDHLVSAVGVAADPETNYFAATHLAYCGQRDRALALLERAIDGNYCAHPAMTRDPLLADIATDPRFPGLVAKGIACRERFERFAGG